MATHRFSNCTLLLLALLTWLVFSLISPLGILMKNMMIIKSTVLFVVMGFLVGCGSAAIPEGRIHTQVSVKDALIADEYRIRVDFSAKAQQQAQLSNLLAKQTAPFLEWSQQSFAESQLISENLSMQPIYEYPANQSPRQTGYEINQAYVLKGLSQSQYLSAMAKLGDFAVRSFALDGVSASDAALADSQNQMMAQAFAKNQQQAQSLAKLAGLCGLQAIEVKPQQYSAAQPRMMMLEAASMDAPPTEQNLSLNLSVSWAAHPC